LQNIRITRDLDQETASLVTALVLYDDTNICCYLTIGNQMKPLIIFQEKIGYQFKKPEILQEAVTHKSYAYERRENTIFPHNERLEFLGDAVLDLAISELLMHKDFAASEGALSKRRATLVNETTLADVAREWEVQDYLLLGHGEVASQGAQKNSILSSALEAVFGAIFLDGGLQAAIPVVQKLFGTRIDSDTILILNKDYKTRLQESMQGKFKVVPKYQIESTTGPEHKKTFTVAVYLKDERLAEGTGGNRKEAEQDAARKALEENKI
jgi:ribonuclease III